MTHKEESNDSIGRQIAQAIREKLLPLCGEDYNHRTGSGGYDCCGCSSYEKIVEDAAKLAEEFEND